MEKEARLSYAGWIFLIASWGAVAGVSVYCFYKIFVR